MARHVEVFDWLSPSKQEPDGNVKVNIKVKVNE
jgi:hypothetical protein